MHKLVPLLVLIATGSTFSSATIAIEARFASTINRPSAAGSSGYGDRAILLAGGMGGGGAGGMIGGGGMTGGGMTGGGMTGGGMTGGGMGNATAMPRPSTGATTGYAPGIADPPAGGAAPYASETAADGPQHPQYYHCVTKRGRCSVSAELGARRPGASCSCLFGGKGKIR